MYTQELMSALEERSSPHVCCVMVNWNGLSDTERCLDSLCEQSYRPLTVLVVDNGSTDGSVEVIRERHPWVTVIETGRNLGFASGTNVGIRRAKEMGAEHIWLLNNDTVAAPDTLDRLVAKVGPGVGAVGTVLYAMRDGREVQAWGGGEVKPWLAHSRHYHAPRPMGRWSYLTFASVLIPMDVLVRVGILYEGFFLYFEDADLSLRMHRHGLRLVVAEDTAVLHREGGSSAKRSPLVDQFTVTSGMRFLRRHAAVPVLSMMVFVGIKLLNRMVRLEWRNVAGVWRGVRQYVRERRTMYVETLA